MNGETNCSRLEPDYITTHHIISSQLRSLGLLWKAEILWEKNNYNAKYTAWGSWKSPSMPYLKYTWEYIEVFDKETHKKAGLKEDIHITDEEFKEWVIGKWSVPPETRMKEHGHPAMFPEEIPRRLLKLFSYRGTLSLIPSTVPGPPRLLHGRIPGGLSGLISRLSIAGKQSKESSNQAFLQEEGKSRLLNFLGIEQNLLPCTSTYEWHFGIMMDPER